MALGAAATLFWQRSIALRLRPPSEALAVIVATLFRVFHARLDLANSPSGRSPVSQDAASAYEIALGVVSGSSLPDAVTRVT